MASPRKGPPSFLSDCRSERFKLKLSGLYRTLLLTSPRLDFFLHIIFNMLYLDSVEHTAATINLDSPAAQNIPKQVHFILLMVSFINNN